MQVELIDFLSVTGMAFSVCERRTSHEAVSVLVYVHPWMLERLLESLVSLPSMPHSLVVRLQEWISAIQAGGVGGGTSLSEQAAVASPQHLSDIEVGDMLSPLQGTGGV